MSAMTQSKQKAKDTVPSTVESEWQRLWFQLQARPWTSLALVPTDSDIDVTAAAEALVAVGRKNGHPNLTLLNGIGVRPHDVQSMLSAVGEASVQGGPVIVACDGLQVNPAALPLARACSGVLVVIRLGASRIDSARRTVEAIGRGRVITSITMRPKS
jgi:hypothetical protein